MSARVFKFPEGVGLPAAPTPPAQATTASLETGSPLFLPGDEVILPATGVRGTVAKAEIGLIQRGNDLVLVWRYTVLFGAVRLAGFLADELRAVP